MPVTKKGIRDSVRIFAQMFSGFRKEDFLPWTLVILLSIVSWNVFSSVADWNAQKQHVFVLQTGFHRSFTHHSVIATRPRYVSLPRCGFKRCFFSRCSGSVWKALGCVPVWVRRQGRGVPQNFEVSFCIVVLWSPSFAKIYEWFKNAMFDSISFFKFTF